MPKIIEQNVHTQAGRIIRKFGSAARLAQALTDAGYPCDRSTVSRWTYPKSRGGSQGLIPTSRWPSLLVAARREGLYFTAEELRP